MNCRTCKHWNPPGEVPDVLAEMVFGVCSRIRHGNGKEDFMDIYDGELADEIAERLARLDKRLLQLAREERAAVADGSGYLAYFHSKGDFGCVLHEAKL